MKECKKEPAYRKVMDFSWDSRIRESLLLKIEEEYFRSFEEDDINYLSAVGSIDEGRFMESYKQNEEEH